MTQLGLSRQSGSLNVSLLASALVPFPRQGPLARKLEYARSTLMSTADLLLQACVGAQVACLWSCFPVLHSRKLTACCAALRAWCKCGHSGLLVHLCRQPRSRRCHALTLGLANCCVCLQAAKKQALARGEKVSMVETDWRWWSQDWADQNPYKARGLAAGTAVACVRGQN